MKHITGNDGLHGLPCLYKQVAFWIHIEPHTLHYLPSRQSDVEVGSESPARLSIIGKVLLPRLVQAAIEGQKQSSKQLTWICIHTQFHEAASRIRNTGWRGVHVDANAHHNRIGGGFGQDAGQLAPICAQHIVGPFDL